MQKRFCDRCKKEIPPPEGGYSGDSLEHAPPRRATISIGLVKEFIGGGFTLRNVQTSTDVTIEGDLCMGCFAVVRDAIHYPPAGAQS